MLYLIIYSLLLFSLSSSQNPPSPTTDPQTVGNINATGLVVPSNQSADLLANFMLELKAADSQLTMSTDLSAMTAVTGKSFSSINGISALCSGTLVLMNDSTNIDFSIIPMLPCDDAEIVAEYLIQVENSNSPCAVLYSLSSQGCAFTSVSSTFETQLGTVFTLISDKSSQSIVSQVNRTVNPIMATILPRNSNNGNGNGASSKNHGSTVAMAILYSITGVLASAFLFIIVSGAIRVHKHPERYGLVAINSSYDPDVGPDEGGGGFGSMNVQYTNRARGLARAVLDSIPLVRFQVEGREMENKEENIGIEDINRDVSIRNSDSDIDSDKNKNKNNQKKPLKVSEKSSETVTNPRINPTHHIGTLIGHPDEQDCPICFEGFKNGDILRILPCKHQFHALCVDPWLLNSSALCPLCRVDLSLESGDDANHSNTNNLAVPPDYEVEISLFNRLLDIWNAQLLPRDARRAALSRFHEEAEIRRQLRARQRNAFDEQNRRRWINFVDSRRILYQLRGRNRGDSAGVENIATDSRDARGDTAIVDTDARGDTSGDTVENIADARGDTTIVGTTETTETTETTDTIDTTGTTETTDTTPTTDTTDATPTTNTTPTADTTDTTNTTNTTNTTPTTPATSTTSTTPTTPTPPSLEHS